MHHDFHASSDEAADERFRAWLEAETAAGLQRSYGDGEATKAVIFLFVNRAYESRMPELMIAATFGRCVVLAGYREKDDESAFAWFEFAADIARQVHSGI